jgi:D-alanine-D-alanine ligase
MGDQAGGALEMTRFKRIAVLLGGLSPEREVSLVSGRACAKALRDEGFEVQEFDAGHDLAMQLGAYKPDAAFNALHGRWGEDGCVQGMLELMEIPYTHSGVLASALAMHKERAKAVFRAAGLPLADSVLVDRKSASERHVMKPPYVLKPVNQGSSVGVFIVRPGDNRPPEELRSEKWTLGEEVMVEDYVPGRELTVAVMGTKALAVTEIISKTALAFYDYDAKYAPGGSEHVVPAKLAPSITEAALRLAEQAHAALGCRGVSRTDFRFDDTKGKNRLIVLEVNTQPGMTPTSLVPEQASYRGMSFNALVRWIIEDASCDR